MLKALQLVGFKSFADKTKFQFPKGITVVVGPNGSGKSNIVDAVKWVLGEQSVKSLRGKEMADVIFNGSGSRRPMNSAEVVLTFENSDGRLPIDSHEVHVARRVYRSGEGEYLINGQPTRLRDIRDLFAGTGVSTQAYSIIEQGKVDVMLQASPRDRRLIFEEAAGISRFKAKKLEAIRRLDRVDQNLLRLSDIVDEVENRLRMVRKQAGKARRYREYSDRLQELRTQVGLTDWRRLSKQLEHYQNGLAELRTSSVEFSARCETLETRTLELETEIETAEQVIRENEQETAENRERIAAGESTIEHERTRRRDLDQEIQRRSGQLATMNSRTRDLGSQLESTLQDVAAAESRFRQIREHATEIEHALNALTDQSEAYRQQYDVRRTEHTDQVRISGTLGNEITSLETKIQAAKATFQRSRHQSDDVHEACGNATTELDSLKTKQESHAAELGACEKQWTTAKGELDQYQKQLELARSQLAELREAFTGASERATVLEELEKRYEGVSSGIREVLVAARESSSGPFREVRGLVADVLEVEVEAAQLIETALGERTGYLVVGPGKQLREYLLREPQPFSGRVGFISNDAPPAAVEIDLSGHSGVVRRADQFVRAKPGFADLAERLLGTTWVVEDLASAFKLASTTPGQSYVTLAGQLLCADGTLCVGPKQGTTGLISRRSELRVLKQRIDDLTQQIENGADSVERLNETVADAHARVETLTERRESLQHDVAECHRQISAAEARHAELQEKYESLQTELNHARGLCDGATTDLALVRDRRQQVDARLAKLEELLAQDEQAVKDVEIQRQERAGQATAAQVELAKCEQQLDSLTTRLRQFEQDHEERQKAIEEAGSHLEDAKQRAAECERRTLKLEGDVAELYLRKESVAQQSVKLNENREQLRQQRGEIAVEIQNARGKIRKLESEIHQQELAAGEVRHERDTLAARMREDYRIELADLEHEPTEEEQHEREVVEQEIADLRRKIQNIGNVNLDALEELDGLETRFGELSTQYQDLTAAKKSLEQIIEKINTDSRRLFIETLQTVRGHFQGLFRKLFGGGQGDIIVDDEVDILDSGLEIVARPPGKEPRSISLLSGGEKTLTCVALLLAIFRSRPSPFCVLDEVDAALDEANIERFIGVLQEFLQWTQFIVVTHSKKTMTCAGTLYGVTMQESGISKRVSVRFEDVSETGEILRTVDEDEGAVGDDEDETQAA